MMNKLLEKFLLHSQVIIVLIIFFICVGFLLYFLPKYFSLILITFLFVAITIFIVRGYTNNLSTVIIIFCLFPLLYVSDSVHQNTNIMYLLEIPFFILIIFSLFEHIRLKTISSFSFKTYLGIPILLLFIHSIFLSFLGFYNGGTLDIIMNEQLHYLYYFSFFSIFMMIKNSSDFKLLFKLILFIGVIVSAVYILKNFSSDRRFTTYNNAFLPLQLGIFFSLILNFYKNRKIFFISLLCIIIILFGSFFTQARTLWVCNILTLFTIVLIFFRTKGLLKSFKSIIVLLIILLIPSYFIFKFASKQTQISTPQKTEERISSISTPLEDISFLMRVEVSFYALERFFKNPIFGEGFGKTIPLKIFVKTKYIYPDNSWLYFLWKGGLIGFLLFSWMYFRFFKLSYNLIDNSVNNNYKVIITGIVGGQVGFLLYGLFSANLIGYKINFLSAFCFAFIEYAYFVTKKNKTDLIN